jgi:hypothetical protein
LEKGIPGHSLAQVTEQWIVKILAQLSLRQNFGVKIRKPPTFLIADFRQTDIRLPKIT